MTKVRRVLEPKGLSRQIYTNAGVTALMVLGPISKSSIMGDLQFELLSSNIATYSITASLCNTADASIANALTGQQFFQASLTLLNGIPAILGGILAYDPHVIHYPTPTSNLDKTTWIIVQLHQIAGAAALYCTCSIAFRRFHLRPRR